MCKEEIQEIFAGWFEPIIIFVILGFLVLVAILFFMICYTHSEDNPKNKHSDEYNDCMKKIKDLENSRCDDICYLSHKVSDLKNDVFELRNVCVHNFDEIASLKKDKSRKSKYKK